MKDPLLATVSAVLGICNPKLIEWILWNTGNPLPFGTDATAASFLCAIISSIAGTVALVDIERGGGDSNFKYAALVGIGISYLFVLYYLISVLVVVGQFSGITRVR